MSRHLDRLLRFDVWANQETVASLKQGPPPAKSLRWMGHIIGAEFVWLARLKREPATLPVWPDLSVEECAHRMGTLSGLWPEYLIEAENGERFAEQIRYTNSKGEEWTSSVEDILTHVTIHSAYHRGQIASDLRSAGQVPAYTDFIHAVRQGFIE
jgi:uncharacterized damage-inducible protein DinB